MDRVAVARVAHPRTLEFRLVVAGKERPVLRAAAVAAAPGPERILEKAPGRRLPPESIARAARTLCEGIDAAHAAGLVHGRVSAREIIVEGDAWRLTGLGLPGAAHADIVPPEGDAETKEGDLYGLAVCLYEALAGDKPFSGPEGSLAKSEGRPASLAGRVGLPPGLDAFFARALQSDPARRFHAACELYGALRSLVTPAVH